MQIVENPLYRFIATPLMIILIAVFGSFVLYKQFCEITKNPELSFILSAFCGIIVSVLLYLSRIYIYLLSQLIIATFGILFFALFVGAVILALIVFIFQYARKLSEI